MAQTRLPILDLTPPLGRFAALVLICGVFSLYFPINWPWGVVHQLKTPLDDLIPLVPAFVIPYVFVFFFWGAGLLLWTMAWRPRIFLRLITSFIVGCLVSYIIYLFFQTEVPRPELDVTDGFTRILKWIYSSDRRYNAFPSGHTLGTTILLLYTLPLVSHWWRALFYVCALSIIASTLLLKQHFIPDIIGGLLIGVFAWWAGKRLVSLVAPPENTLAK